MIFWSSSSIYARIFRHGSAFQTEKTFVCPIFAFSVEKKLSEEKLTLLREAEPCKGKR
jgi:hypothetical protein